MIERDNVTAQPFFPGGKVYPNDSRAPTPRHTTPDAGQSGRDDLSSNQALFWLRAFAANPVRVVGVFSGFNRLFYFRVFRDKNTSFRKKSAVSKNS